MEKIDLTYDSKLQAFVTGGENTLENKNLDINFTIDSLTKKVTTTSILIEEDPLFMITFDYQDLKAIVERGNNER